MVCDIFSRNDMRNLLKGRCILMIGDSNVRSLYKDLIYLIVEGTITPVQCFRGGNKGQSFFGDRVISIASKRELGRSYFENREYKEKDICIRYMFITRACSKQVSQELDDVKEGRVEAPSVILINSCVWDLTRWGPLKENQYKKDLLSLFKSLKHSLPEDTLVVWLSTLPVATERVKGGVFIRQVEFLKHSMRFWILEANKFTQQLCLAFGFNFLDLHHTLQFELDIRANDGLHWEPEGVRYLTNQIATHIALNLDVPLPGNIHSLSLDWTIKSTCTEENLDNILLEKQVFEEVVSFFNKESGTHKMTTSNRETRKAKRRLNNPIQDHQQINLITRRQMEIADQERASTSVNNHPHQSSTSQRVETRRSPIAFDFSPVMAHLNPNFWAGYPTGRFPWKN